MVQQLQPTQKTQPTQPARKKLSVTWEPLPKDFVLPDDPVENIQQPLLAAALTDALGAAGHIQPQMLIGSNFGLVATVRNKTIVKAPDWLYVPQVNPVAPGVIRRSYTPNLEGLPIAVVMEFLSEAEHGELSIRSTPPYGKLYFYEQILEVPNYVTYDPYEGILEVRFLREGRYVREEPDDHGLWWIPELELFLGMWQGERLGNNVNWLRWWDRDRNILLWSSEQAEQERARAEQEKARAESAERAQQEAIPKLLGLGLTPEQVAEALGISVEEVNQVRSKESDQI